jgi:hypothetical protein
MIKAGSADLPLHYGQVPPWLAQRMARLGRAVAESIVMDYGASGFLQRLSDPFWFQSLGCVMGMDWHSSGITTSVLGALKRAINPLSGELGLHVCGGRGKHSLQTPSELRALGDATGLDGDVLVRSSRLTAKVDNTAIQDGFQLYLHNFIVSREGEWVVVQQGMNAALRTARRYHWHSAPLRSFVDQPHTAVYGPNRGAILNLTHGDACVTRDGILSVVREGAAGAPDFLEALRARATRPDLAATAPPASPHLVMPAHHDVRSSDINIKRLGAVLALAYERQPMDFESLLLMEGVGPRTLQALTLVSEVIHGTPSRFSDPARFSFAHGGKDGHPFPVPLDVYDQTLQQLERAVTRARLGREDSAHAIKALSAISASLEKDWVEEDRVEEWIAHERATSYQHGGMTVMGPARPPAATSAATREQRPMAPRPAQHPTAGAPAPPASRQKRHSGQLSLF